MDRITRNHIVDRLKRLQTWARATENALDNAEQVLVIQGCNCGDANDLPCALCLVQHALKTIPK